MDKRFLKAFLTPRATRLLGLDLYPWCLKHRIQLTALGHPLMVGGEVTVGDLLSYAKVCAEKPLTAKMGLGDQWRIIRVSFRKGGVDEAMEIAREHMMLDAWPKFWEQPKTEGGESRGGGVPWALSVIANLTRNGLSLEQAMHLPESQAVWLSTTFAVHQGAKVEVLTTDDEALLDSLSTVERPTNEPQSTV